MWLCGRYVDLKVVHYCTSSSGHKLVSIIRNSRMSAFEGLECIKFHAKQGSTVFHNLHVGVSGGHYCQYPF